MALDASLQARGWGALPELAGVLDLARRGQISVEIDAYILAEADVLPTCGELGIGFVPFSPQASGFFTGTTTSGDKCTIGYAEVLPDEKGAIAAAFLTRAVGYFAGHGIHRIERIITDNAFAYRNSNAFREAVEDLAGQSSASSTPLPLDQRQSRTLQPDPANRMGLPAGLHQQPERIHTGIGTTPITRVSPT